MSGRFRFLIPWSVCALLGSAPLPVEADLSGGLAEDLQAASELIRSSRLTEAEARLRAILGQSQEPEALDLLGVVLARTDRPREAEEALQTSVRIAPDRMAPHQNLALLYFRVGAEDRAITHLRRAAELGRLDRNLAARLAQAELAAGNLQAAEAQLQLLSDAHGSVNAQLQLARLQAQQGRHTDALALLRRALAVAPSSEDLLALYARTALASRNPAWTIRPLQALIRMVPEEPDYPYLLGVAHMQVGQLEEAAEVLSAAVDQRPDHLLSFVALGLTLNRSKQYDQAVEALRRAVLLAPENTEALAALAEAYVGSNRDELAEQFAQRALDLDPGNPVAEWSLGMVHMRAGRFAEARDAFQASADREPGSAKTHYQLSLALARLGEQEKSKQHLELYRRAQREAEQHLLELRGMATEPTDEIDPTGEIDPTDTDNTDPRDRK